MKATPELLQQALRVLEIGLNPEISAKILATVRLLDEKGDSADLKDFALIEACYSEEIEPESELLPSDKADLSLLEEGDTVVFRDGKEKQVKRISGTTNKYEMDLGFSDGSSTFYMNDGSFWVDRSYCLEDIVKIIKPTKPQ